MEKKKSCALDNLRFSRICILDRDGTWIEYEAGTEIRKFY